MLAELRVTNLGVIEDAHIVLGPGLTALTGETGAGKTLLVDAIVLLLGGPADAQLVRPGAAEAVVEGRFLVGDAETILSRVVPASGRSRAYLDGRMVAAAQLAEVGSRLVDVHGQNAHQSLLSPAAQRAALDRAGGLSDAEVLEWRRKLRDIKAAQEGLGGDSRTLARELDLLRYQLRELEAARLSDPDEDDALIDEEERLADASGLREVAGLACEGLAGEDGVIDRLGTLVAVLGGRPAVGGLQERLRAAEADLADIAGEARSFAEGIEDDPARLAAVSARRQTLADLRRKYGETLAAVMAFREEVRERVSEIESHDSRAAALDRDADEAGAALAGAEERLWAARRDAAPRLGAMVEANLQDLAMPRARFEVEVEDRPGSDSVTWLLGANPGEPVLPLTKVASGGELSRTMLAARLAVGPAATDLDPATLIFDEVDAGIGGEAAAAVGRALAALAPEHQVLVVTHLPQVAAFADHQLAVTKQEIGGRTVAAVSGVDGSDRVIELSRMLSGRPDSETARRHAEELLAQAGNDRPDGSNAPGSPSEVRAPR